MHEKRILCQVGYLQGSYRDARSTEYKINLRVMSINNVKRVSFYSFLCYFIRKLKYRSLSFQRWGSHTALCTYYCNLTPVWITCLLLYATIKEHI